MTAIVLLLALAQAPATIADRGTIRGVVVDRSGGTPLADVIVQIQDTSHRTVTDAEGRFELAGITPGRRTIYVSVVGYILVKRPIVVRPGAVEEVTIALSEGTGTYSEEVTVTAERFRPQEPGVPSQQVLGSAEILNLRNLLTNDPMRAIQILPGVTTGDDFRSEFAVRGSGFHHMSFTFDGVPAAFLLHTVRQVQDGGSIAMVNGDVLSGITLLNGSYPQRYGNRLGAELHFTMREGSRERTQARISVTGTDASVVMEGPLGRRRAGSWIVSARKSYLDFLLRQITDEDEFGFSFADAQAKLVFDLSPAERLELTAVAGGSKLDQSREGRTSLNFLQFGTNSAQLLTAALRKTHSPAVVATHRVALAANQYENTNPHEQELGHGGGSDLTWRSDVTAARGSVTMEGGAQLQLHAREDFRRELRSRNRQDVVQSFDRRALWSSAFVHTRWTPGSWSLGAGARIDHWNHAGGAHGSPWLSAERRFGRGVTMRASAGLHRQVPGIEQTTGMLSSGATPPGVERAYGIDIGVEQTIGTTARWQLTLYNRQERDLYRLWNSEPRMVTPDSATGFFAEGPWLTSVEGYARGLELLAQRRSSSGLTGWLAYSFGVSRYRDSLWNEAFDGDFDQRHTVNAYLGYRVSNRTNIAARLRAGTNFPAPGYWEERAEGVYLSTERNRLRVPAYTRLDLRASRTFNWRSRRLTLFAEVINALDRENARFVTPDIQGVQGPALFMFESMLPRLPSAGFMIEF